VTGSFFHQFAESAEDETGAEDEPCRDIMLVIAGGEGYVDFRRGIQLAFFTLRISVESW